MKQEIIQISAENFQELVARVIAFVKERYMADEDKYVEEKEAMRLLNIKSKSTMLSLRNSGQITFTQPMKKVILYSKHSINQFLEKHERKSF